MVEHSTVALRVTGSIPELKIYLYGLKAIVLGLGQHYNKETYFYELSKTLRFALTMTELVFS